MNKFIVLFLFVAVLANNVVAFTMKRTITLATRGQKVPSPSCTMSEFPPSSSTALQLKVKVDPDAKGNKNIDGNTRMAAYGGSIVVAALLPLAFLVWAALSH